MTIPSPRVRGGNNDVEYTLKITNTRTFSLALCVTHEAKEALSFLDRNDAAGATIWLEIKRRMVKEQPGGRSVMLGWRVEQLIGPDVRKYLEGEK